ncbi:glycoside hydrolase family protein [Anaeromyxobacter oryzae]|uniref:Glycosyl hydrolase family 32 N-terminal domain-containing protein n=1 Tax=Anaeromyxobacter oryzae TaxID=2918170 RepID=A0ABM7X057_9BACT|nr:hypothetical protein [Anaeromyxobacter oryzae]BDG05125.1 hypothetical protein AMOR_41210 [Anaeromyxobacter oryzae]
MRFGIRLAATATALAGLLACGGDASNVAPIAWQKVSGPGPGGALLGLGAPGSFDERGNFTVTAVEDGGVTRLYYGGSDSTGDPSCPGIRDSHWRIGLAQSSDGVSFTRVPGAETGGAILDVGAPGAFDSWLAYRPFVLKDGATYRMWYNGSTKPFHCPTGTLADDRRVGYAESTDGVHWTKHYDGAGPGGSVLPLGAPGEFDAQQVGYVWVIRDGDQYKMYYSANDALNSWRVGLAVSSDARTWTKVRGNGANGAVLDLGGPGSLDAACAYQPSVVKERQGLYRMWYRGCEAPSPFGGPSGGTIGYAESSDGITWVKVPQPGAGGAALGAGAAGQFDSGGLTTPSVSQGTTWTMYYAGFDTSGQFLAGLARGTEGSGR